MRLSGKLLVLFLASMAFNTAVAAVLEEIIVTAQKREQNIQDVGIAVTALSGNQMAALGYDNAQDITAMAAGVSTVQPNGEANYAVAMRGVAANDFTTNIESPVAVYLDEVYISQMSGTGFDLFDMERVELLKGPQGTLFGRNATGGLVHFVSVKPQIGDVQGYSKLTWGDYGQVRLEGALGGGLTEQLSARLSISTHDNNGYVKNRLGGRLNNANDRAGRLQIRWQPSTDTDVLLRLRYAEQDIDTGFFEHVSAVGAPGELTPELQNTVLEYLDNDGDPFTGSYDDPGYNDLETQGYSLTLSHNFDAFTLTSITDYSTVERKYIEDSDASPVPLFNFFLNTDAEQFSQEVRVSGASGSFNWVAGLYYLALDIDDSNGAITHPFYEGPLEGPALPDGSEGGLINPYTSELQSFSGFGQIEWAFTPNMKLIAGARIINDDKDFTYATWLTEFVDPEARDFDAAGNIRFPVDDPLASYEGSRDDTEVSTRLALDWSPTEDSLYYLSWNRGVRGGGFNAPVFPLSPPLAYDDATFSYDPETLNAFEVGAKWSFMGGRHRLNTAVYYYDYEDYQAFNIIGLDTITLNAQADSRGFELEWVSSPGAGWDILFGIAWNDINVKLPDGSRTTSVQSPEWALNGLVRKEWQVELGTLALQADAWFRSEHYFSLTGLDAVTENGYTVARVSGSLTSSNNKWQATAFIDNVTDEEYLVQTFDLSTVDSFGMVEQYYGRPRWWGLSLRYSL